MHTNIPPTNALSHTCRKAWHAATPAACLPALRQRALSAQCCKEHRPIHSRRLRWWASASWCARAAADRSARSGRHRYLAKQRHVQVCGRGTCTNVREACAFAWQRYVQVCGRGTYTYGTEACVFAWQRIAHCCGRGKRVWQTQERLCKGLYAWVPSAGVRCANHMCSGCKSCLFKEARPCVQRKKRIHMSSRERSTSMCAAEKEARSCVQQKKKHPHVCSSERSTPMRAADARGARGACLKKRTNLQDAGA